MQNKLGDSKTGWDEIWVFVARLRAAWRLLWVVLGTTFVLWLAYYAMVRPTYVATAVIGPPNPSPVSGMISSLSGAPSTGGIARRLLGGQQGGATNDPFQEYLQLLQSRRLAAAVSENDEMLQVVFHRQWDQEKRQWRKPGAILGTLGAALKRFFKRPVKSHPDQYDLIKFLKAKMSVSEASTKKSSVLNTTSSGYMIVSLSLDDREQAEKVLDTLLRRADTIIRDEQRRDIEARISYLKSELPNVTQQDQRDALVNILSGQQSLMMMVQADHRFASTLVDPPDASPIPTSPAAPIPSIIIVISLSLICWLVMVGIAPKVPLVRRILDVLDMKQGVKDSKSADTLGREPV